MGNFKKMLFGEKMPDKNDPQYRERYKKEVGAGRKFAKTMRIDRLAVCIQSFANSHRRRFLCLVFGFVILSFGFNMYRIVHAGSASHDKSTATQRQEQMLERRHQKLRKTLDAAHCAPPGILSKKNDNQTK